jgi:hypothetical protein
MVIHISLDDWIRFYAKRARSKDSDIWRQLRASDAALREWTVRSYYDKALAGELTKEDKAYHKVLAFRGYEDRV